MALVADPNTLSNHLALATEHTAVDVALDFKASVLSGTAVLEMKVLEEEVKEVVLDSSYLDIQKVEVNGTPAEWKVADRKEPYGSAVTVALVGKPTKGETLKVKVCTLNLGWGCRFLMEVCRSRTLRRTNARRCSGWRPSRPRTRRRRICVAIPRPPARTQLIE